MKTATQYVICNNSTKNCKQTRHQHKTINGNVVGLQQTRMRLVQAKPILSGQQVKPKVHLMVCKSGHPQQHCPSNKSTYIQISYLDSSKANLPVKKADCRHGPSPEDKGSRKQNARPWSKILGPDAGTVQMDPSGFI